MIHKVKIIILLSIYFATCASAVNNTELEDGFVQPPLPSNVMDVSDFSVYYDMKTNQTIKEMMPRPWYRPGWPLRLPFVGGPCTCESYQCTCCSGIRIPVFKYDKQVCSRLTFNHTESLIDMEVMMNGERIFMNTYSARNPPPFCVPLPVPYLPPGLVDMCVRLFDINVMGERLHVCMDMDTRIDKAPVLVLHFDCMNMGLGGVSLSKPGSSDTGGIQTASSNDTNTSVSTTVAPEQLAGDIYDFVEEKDNNKTNSFDNSIKYI